MTAKNRNIVFMLTLLQVMQRTGLSRSTIYNKLNPRSLYHDPSFPRSVRLGSSGVAIRFVEDEVNSWLEQCVLASRESLKKGGEL